MIFRVRAAAVIINDKNELLMVHHRHPDTKEEWWTLPGGGLKRSESAYDAVIREVQEECNILCVPGKIIYIREFIDIKNSVHHVELFFLATTDNYNIVTGKDPEFKRQIIQESKFLSKEQIQNINTSVFPEILKDIFWDDLDNNFIYHNNYLGIKIWENGFIIEE